MVRLILAGGGGAEKSKIVDEFYFNLLLEENKKNNDNSKIHLLYIPIALFENKKYFDNCEKWIADIFPKLKITTIKNLAEIKKYNLDDFDSIYIGGGNTYLLLDEINKNNFREIIQYFADNNKIIYGGSAGAIILGNNISITHDENKVELKEFNGFNFIKNCSVSPHYVIEEDLDIKNYIKKYNENIIAIPEESGVYINDNLVKVIGSKKCVLFNKNLEKINFSINDNFEL